MTSKTFLQLCERLRQESGISGAITSTTGNSGILAKIVYWVQSAWVDLQNHNTDWNWMWSQATVNTVSGIADYEETDFTDVFSGLALSAGAVSRWATKTMKIYKQSDGQPYEGPLSFIEYQQWRLAYGYGTVDDNAPAHFTILPSGKIKFHPAPDDVHVATIDYYKAASEFSGDSDTPGCPAQYHDCIWAMGLVDYAAHDEAVVLGKHQINKAKKILNRLSGNARPQIKMGNSPLG